LRWVLAGELPEPDDSLERRGLEVRAVIEPSATLNAALESLLGSHIGVVAVVDGDGALLGVVDLRTIMSAVETTPTAPQVAPETNRDAADGEFAAR
jgi:CBS domain-containing protein